MRLAESGREPIHAGILALCIGGCGEEPPRYPPPVYIDYTRGAPPNPAGPRPVGPPMAQPPARPVHAAPAPASADGPTIGDALAPFGIALPPNISLLKLPPPSVWQNWPFTWPNLPAPTATAPPPTNTPSSPTPAPVPPPAASPPGGGIPSGWTADEAAVLAETNRRRTQGATCGGEPMPPAPPLEANFPLTLAAREHSSDMAQNNYFDHTSLDGRSVEQRTRAAGFPGGFIGENIAAGRSDAQATVQQWMDSPGHCLNIMEPRYRFLGVGHASNPATRLNHFWTQNFGG